MPNYTPTTDTAIRFWSAGAVCACLSPIEIAPNVLKNKLNSIIRCRNYVAHNSWIIGERARARASISYKKFTKCSQIIFHSRRCQDCSPLQLASASHKPIFSTRSQLKVKCGAHARQLTLIGCRHCDDDGRAVGRSHLRYAHFQF